MLFRSTPWNDDFAPQGDSGRENGYARDDGIAEIPLSDFVEIFRVMRIETDEPFDGTRAGANAARQPASTAD